MGSNKSYAVITVGSTNFPLLILSLFYKFSGERCIISHLLGKYDLIYLQCGNSSIIQHNNSKDFEPDSSDEFIRLLEVQWSWLVSSASSFKKGSHAERVSLPIEAFRNDFGSQRIRIIMKPYFDDMSELLKRATLVISHAGSGSLLEFLLGPSGSPNPSTKIFEPRFMLACPNPFLMDNHQEELCNALDGLNFVDEKGNLKLMILNCGDNLLDITKVQSNIGGDNSIKTFLNQKIHNLYLGIFTKLEDSTCATNGTTSLSASK
jgi:UDP-N-acetylglucosamine transferase subunit ALG13